jgi:hypothetical protein
LFCPEAAFSDIDRYTKANCKMFEGFEMFKKFEGFRSLKISLRQAQGPVPNSYYGRGGRPFGPSASSGESRLSVFQTFETLQTFQTIQTLCNIYLVHSE